MRKKKNSGDADEREVRRNRFYHFFFSIALIQSKYTLYNKERNIRNINFTVPRSLKMSEEKKCISVVL